jgi:hypothetical protein
MAMFMDNLKEQDMKKIVRGNDFTLRIPVKKIVNGEQVSFPLTDCTDIAVHVVSKYKRTALPYTIDKESNDVLLADVDGTTLSLGTYALEVTGVLEGANWRSYEYEQFAIVDNNASSDTTLGDEVISGALVILPPGSSSLKPDIPQKVKKRKQIMIGKAIRCKSCDVLDAENWYVFSQNFAFLLLPSGIDKDDMVVHYRPKFKNEYETLDNFELFKKTAEVVTFGLFVDGPLKWKVEKYLDDPTTGKFEVWLVYTSCPKTIKGMGTKYEYVNGRKVWNRTLYIGDVTAHSVVTLCNTTRFSVYHKKSYTKSRNLRNESKIRKRKCLRWKRLNGIYSVSRKNRPGLYRISLKDSNSSKKVSFDFYFRRIGNDLYPIKA